MVDNYENPLEGPIFRIDYGEPKLVIEINRDLINKIKTNPEHFATVRREINARYNNFCMKVLGWK